MAGRFNRTLGAAGVALLALAGPVAADGYEGGMKDAAPAPEGRQFSWSFNMAGTSEYVFRGISQSNEDPAFQAGIDASYGIFYIGTWGSGIDFDGGGSAEIDFYGGIKPVWGPVTFDLGVIYYWYPNSTIEDPFELKAGYSWSPITNLTSGGTFYYEPDLDYWVYESTLAYTFPAIRIFTPSISGTYGIFEIDDGVDYNYWNAGLTLAVEKFSFDFRYWDTDISDVDCLGLIGHAGHCDERFVFTAKVTLP